MVPNGKQKNSIKCPLLYFKILVVLKFKFFIFFGAKNLFNSLYSIPTAALKPGG